jgi:hypothetical protein
MKRVAFLVCLVAIVCMVSATDSVRRKRADMKVAAVCPTGEQVATSLFRDRNYKASSRIFRALSKDGRKWRAFRWFVQASYAGEVIEFLQELGYAYRHDALMKALAEIAEVDSNEVFRKLYETWLAASVPDGKRVNVAQATVNALQAFYDNANHQWTMADFEDAGGSARSMLNGFFTKFITFLKAFDEKTPETAYTGAGLSNFNTWWPLTIADGSDVRNFIKHYAGCTGNLAHGADTDFDTHLKKSLGLNGPIITTGK